MLIAMQRGEFIYYRGDYLGDWMSVKQQWRKGTFRQTVSKIVYHFMGPWVLDIKKQKVRRYRIEMEGNNKTTEKNPTE